jgi:hypothetical protein
MLEWNQNGRVSELSRRNFVRMVAATVAMAGSGISLGPAQAQQAPAEPAKPPGSPHKLGGNKHLFIDDWLTAEKHNVVLTVNPPERKGLALIADKPWERGGLTSYANVLWDHLAKEYRMYYVPIVVQGGQRWCLALASSRDGITWEKPELGVIERDGTKKNNIVIEMQREGTVIIDPHAPPQRQYAFLSSDRDGMVLFTSPDGVHFTQHPQRLSPHHSDSQLSSFWDDQRQKYVHYFKVAHGGGEDWYKSPQIRINPNIPFPQSEPLGRSVARFETSSMDEPWQGPFTVVMARDNDDPPGTDLYTNSCVKYALTPDVYFAFPTPYYHYNHPGRSYLNEPALKLGGKTNDGSLDTQLAVSRDGIFWTRYRTPYVPVHHEQGLYFPVNMIFPGLLYHEDRIDQFYAGYTFTHGDTGARTRLQGRELGGYLRVSQRIDGFVSADFAYTGGRLVTRPFIFEGARLWLNVNTSASGEGRVAILDEAGQAIPGFTIDDCRFINGDYLAKMVSWKDGAADTSALAGRPVRLAFEMRGTKLYSFWFGSAEQA